MGFIHRTASVPFRVLLRYTEIKNKIHQCCVGLCVSYLQSDLRYFEVNRSVNARVALSPAVCAIITFFFRLTLFSFYKQFIPVLAA